MTLHNPCLNLRVTGQHGRPAGIVDRNFGSDCHGNPLSPAWANSPHSIATWAG